MSLLLVQHGKSLPKAQDPEQGLASEGKTEVERIAGIIGEHGIRLSTIYHSGKKRAKQTAEIFAEAIGPTVKVIEKTGLAPLDDVTAVNPAVKENVMFVGHLPFMEKLTSFLITGASDSPPVIKFQNAGIVCLDIDGESGSWFIKWTLFPSID